ncbi:hypothetical protein GGR32_002392 [Mesonia hippocampi]|uniref:Hyaluronidase n=1 Tax=Mesonia hippocampi TaxID=1628250 RepID=A0A840ESZ7_9FLAO|nr:hypothetical protein [Mesonia hippocampi]MBB4120080.1 hypothetical protein [Mesonia hippocampi]
MKSIREIMYKIIILLVALLNYSCSAQEVRPVIQSGRYSQEVSLKMDNYYFFGSYYIDPTKKGIIDLKTLEKGILKVIKDLNYSGYVVLNIENKVYQELRSNSMNHKNYHHNIRMMVGAVELVKELRPKAKVMIYNIPFRFISENHKKYSDFDKLYPLLRAVDVFAPSLYLHHDEKEKKPHFFSTYIKNNLDLSFEYAEKLNKKVYPFVWYKIHPSNKNYGGNIISSNQYSEYLKLIKNYRYKNERVEKVIYWEPANETIDINQKLKETVELYR